MEYLSRGTDLFYILNQEGAEPVKHASNGPLSADSRARLLLLQQIISTSESPCTSSMQRFLDVRILRKGCSIYIFRLLIQRLFSFFLRKPKSLLQITMTTQNPPTLPSPLPPWAKPSHTISTPRLLLRTAVPSDAPAFTHLFSEPLNNPFGGVVGNSRTEAEQLINLTKQGGPTGSTARGENAWLVVILSPPPSEPLPDSAEVLRAEDGLLIGSTGFNEFKLEKDEAGNEILRADIGCLIDWRFQRKGYALETLEAIIEYGFNEFKAKEITAGTNVENLPWRRLMDIMVHNPLPTSTALRQGSAQI